MPLSRSLKQRARSGAGKSASAPTGQSRDANGVMKRTGRERPDAAQDSPVEPLDTKARIIKTNS